MDKIIIDFFENIHIFGHIVLILIELICAALFAGLIGYERESIGHAAGLRTHILVSVGACLIMIVSISGPGFGDATRDPARIAAQVVSGIGFLGAGTIIQNGTNVKGLTTAATIWLCGGIGLACGAGYFSGAIIATIVSLVSLILLIKVEVKISKQSPRIMLIVNGSQTNVLKDIMELSTTFEVEIKDIRSNLVKTKDGDAHYHITLTLNKNSILNIESFADELKNRLLPIDFKLYRK